MNNIKMTGNFSDSPFYFNLTISSVVDEKE